MAIRIEPFAAGRSAAVVAFNRRMAARGASWQFPERPDPGWLSRREGNPLFQEFFLACEGEAVRGAYVLQHRAIALCGVE